jgi:hypothetical protein
MVVRIVARYIIDEILALAEHSGLTPYESMLAFGEE